ncbi:hypothetical protein MBRU_17745 [Mycolicibacterium brumae DSM 44177]|nr:hypothetical protein MBRU_17745 [Mycolicibacterium brumae DSM 44177]
MLAAAASWTSLSAEYADTATELSAVLASVEAGSWEGSSAAQYLVSHLPFLAWLSQASTNSAALAAQHETAAAAYSGAVATMPTMAELTANRTTQAVLASTNFLGINTVPMAINEANYIRMWIQAAATMAAYDLTAGTAVRSAPITDVAPPILAVGDGDATANVMSARAMSTAADSGFRIPNPLYDWLVANDPIDKWLAGVSEHFHGMYVQLRDIIFDPINTAIRLGEAIASEGLGAIGPSGSMANVFFLFAYGAVFALIGTPLYPAFAAPAAIALPIALGLGGMGNYLDAYAEPPAEAAPEQPQLAASVPAGNPTPTAGATATGGASSATTPAPSPAPTTPAPASPTVVYAVGGDDPGIGFGPGLRSGAQAAESASESAYVGASAAAAAAAAARRKARRKRHQGGDANVRAYRYEFLDATPDPEPTEPERPTVVAGGKGAGTVGFTGVTGPKHLGVAGLTVLAADDETPVEPMLPSDWERN